MATILFVAISYTYMLKCIHMYLLVLVNNIMFFEKGISEHHMKIINLISLLNLVIWCFLKDKLIFMILNFNYISSFHKELYKAQYIIVIYSGKIESLKFFYHIYKRKLFIYFLYDILTILFLFTILLSLSFRPS